MNLSRRTDYALRLVAALASDSPRIASARSVAEDQDAPYAFIRSIQHDLVEAGLIESQRGAGGGMRLTRPPEELTLLDVIQAIDGEVHVSSCTGGDLDCTREEACLYHQVWDEADRILSAYYDSITIADLLQGTVPQASLVLS